MGKSSDQLREEIDAQRAETGAKIDQLQGQVRDTMNDAKQQVTDTATQVRDEAQAMVTDTVDSVKKTVEDFDIEGYVQQRPLMSVGVAMVGGFLLGAMLGGDGNGHHSHSYNASTTYDSSPHSSGGGSTMSGLGSSLRNAAQKSGLEDTISNAGAALMGSVTEQLKDMVDRSFPGFSDKLSNVQQQSGSFTDKAQAATEEAQQQ